MFCSSNKNTVDHLIGLANNIKWPSAGIAVMYAVGNQDNTGHTTRPLLKDVNHG